MELNPLKDRAMHEGDDPRGQIKHILAVSKPLLAAMHAGLNTNFNKFFS
jgi:hypothetical protein